MRVSKLYQAKVEISIPSGGEYCFEFVVSEWFSIASVDDFLQLLRLFAVSGDPIDHLIRDISDNPLYTFSDSEFEGELVLLPNVDATPDQGVLIVSYDVTCEEYIHVSR